MTTIELLVSVVYLLLQNTVYNDSQTNACMYQL